MAFSCTGRESNPYALRRRNLKTGESEASCATARDSAGSEDQRARDEAQSEAVLPRFAAAREPDQVEVALARALTDASAAGRFDVVIQLAKELEGRRLAHLSRVIPVAMGSGSNETDVAHCSRERPC